ncbi:MAG TPA: SRPBCC family protein [Polyangia bacterium]|jgi:uncharacterized protein YndB with AHSA1/START domain|nr:SRPBCC family protein [Polyangia bacterium]
MAKLGLALLVVVVVLVIVIATRPAEFRIVRKVQVAAPADQIFPLIDDFHQWSHWSPYDRLDPNLVKTYSGAERGVGAVYAWAGNDKAGAGSMTITASHPNDRVAIALAFTKPFASHSVAEFTLAPEAGGTTVTWAMTGHNGFAFKAFGLFVNVDKLVGGDFERGLDTLRRVAEEANEHRHEAAPPKP